MSDARRRFVRFSIFLLPAILPLAALHGARADLRDAAASRQNPGYSLHGHRFLMRRDRYDVLGPWTHRLVKFLGNNNRIYGFKAPEGGFRIEIRSEPGASECDAGSNQILLRGVAENARLEDIQEDLSRLIAKAMLRTGAPDAGFSSWFEEGVSLYYQGTQEPFGSRKDQLILRAARIAPVPLATALAARKEDPYFPEVSHSLVAFLHIAYSDDARARYASVEREPGPVPPGEFRRLFGEDFERAWHEFLERR